VSVITVFSGVFCKEDHVVRNLLAKTGYKLVTDKDIVTGASKLSGISEGKVNRAFSSKTSVFNKFTHEKERTIAHLRLALAEMLSGQNLLFVGFTTQLIPKEISHVLRICLIADMKFKILVAKEENGLSEREATKIIQRHDEDCAVWTNTLFHNNDPWDASLNDIVIPMNKMTIEDATALIEDNMVKDVLKPTRVSRKAVEDFLLASKAQVALAGEGHSVGVSADDGSLILTINKHVVMLGRFQDELTSIAEKVPGVKRVETKVGTGYHQANIYRKHDFKVPPKVLLVDDEREFVQTLSERLMIRDMGSTVAYDGESALNLIKEDEPEVMIVDLKMPGIDGIEVLRRVKETRPEIEVIILTAHGSEGDKNRCMQLGAFAYLQKPLDIDALSDTIKEANEKIRQNKAAKDHASDTTNNS